MTWWREADGGRYGVLFNRDEKKTRTKGERPEPINVRGVSCIAPRDPDGGGTWILCNAFGAIIAVLNAYQTEPRQPNVQPARYLSRGTLPHLLADIRDVATGVARVLSLDATSFRPFTAVVIDSTAEACLQSTASGKILKLPEPIHQPLVSSSYEPEAVFAARRETYATMVTEPQSADREILRSFHRNPGKAPSAYTPKMLRSDAQTFSLTELQIDSALIRCSYEAYPAEFAGEPEHFQCSIARQDQEQES